VDSGEHVPQQRVAHAHSVVQLVPGLLVVAIVVELTCLDHERVWPVWVAEAAEQHNKAARTRKPKAALVPNGQESRDGVRSYVLCRPTLINRVHHEIGIAECIEGKDSV
jgi:hypothetical protein